MMVRLGLGRAAAAAVLTSVLFVGAASAQTLTEGTSAEALAEPPGGDPTFWEAGGVRVSDSTVLHPRVEVGTAYQPNVFYQDDSDPQGPLAGGRTGAVSSAVVRVGAGATLATRPPVRMELQPVGGASARPRLNFKGDFDLTWHQYLSDYQPVTKASALEVNLLVDARVNPEGQTSIIVRNGYTRSVRAAVAEYGYNPRHRDDFTLGFDYKPGGGAIHIVGNYLLSVSLFEQFNFATQISHTFNVGGRWQFLPKTQFQLDAFLGYTSTSVDFRRRSDPDAPPTYQPSSTPMRFLGGMSTLFTPTFGTVLKVGWGYAPYDVGPNYNSFLALAEARWAIGPIARIAFGYKRDFHNSLIANFEKDDEFYARFATQIGGRWQFRGKAAVIMRTYEGVAAEIPSQAGSPAVINCPGLAPGLDTCTRNDLISSVEAGLDYQINAWLGAGASYTFLSNTTDSFTVTPSGADLDSNGYVWMEFLARVAAKW